MTAGIKKPGGNSPSKYQQLASVLLLRKSIKSACERTTRWLTVHAYWTMAWGEALSGKISRLSLSGLLFLLKIRMFIPFFAATQKDFALFLYLCSRIRQIKK